MLEEVRRSKLAKLEKKLDDLQHQYAAMFDELNTLASKLSYLRYCQKKGISAYYKGKKEFTFIEANFTARKEYQAYQAALDELGTLPRKISELDEQLIILKKRVLRKINRSGILEARENLKEQIETVKNAKTLEELGVTPFYAISRLQNHSDVPVLSKNDDNPKVVTQRKKKLRHLKAQVRNNLLSDHYAERTTGLQANKITPDDRII